MLTIHKLKVKYPRFSLSIENLVFEAGITILFGPNGAGKTTLLDAMLGVREAAEAQVSMRGENLALPLANGIKERIAFMSAAPFLWNRRNGVFHGQMYEILYPKFCRDRFTDYLYRFGLNSRQKTSTLSSGQRRMLHFSLCASTNPDLFVLDEPFAFLDYNQSRLMMEMLSEIVEENPSRLVIVSSHLIHWLNTLKLPAVALFQGQVIAKGILDQPYESYFQPDCNSIK